jgi:hypothetical protein
VANTCQPGLFCLSESSGSTQGTCTTLCDLFTSPSCPNGKVCDLFSSREGVCVSDIDPTGSEPYDSCSVSGNMCDHAVPCIGFVDGSNGCRAFCRPGSGDCGPTPNGASVVCNNYVSPGQRTYGLCLGPECSPGDCGERQCVAGICRRTCSPGSEVQDCCGGTTPCDWACVNQLCE